MNAISFIIRPHRNRPYLMPQYRLLILQSVNFQCSLKALWEYPLDMCPRPSQNDITNRSPIYAVLLSQLSLRYSQNVVSVSNRKHSFFGQFCKGVILTYGLVFPAYRAILRGVTVPTVLGPPSTLSPHIVVVVLSRTEKQVFRINARRIVALMQDAKSVRNIPKVKNPRDTVGPTTVRGPIELTVAVVGLISQPYPARSKTLTKRNRLLTNLCPESDLTWYFLRSHDLNLRHRLGLWLGSLAASTACGPLVF